MEVPRRGGVWSKAPELSDFESGNDSPSGRQSMDSDNYGKYRMDKDALRSDAEYQSMTEKGIRRLCSELLDLKRVSIEEMQKNVFANYTVFIRTSQELSELEAEMNVMQGLISTHASLVRDLLEGFGYQTSSHLTERASRDLSSRSPDENSVPSELDQQKHMLMEVLDVLIVERRADEALALLMDQERILLELRKECGEEEPMLALFQSALFQRKARLVEQLSEVAQFSSIRHSELCKAVFALNKLGDGSRAHSLLLKSHLSSLRANTKSLRSSSTWYTGAYITALAQGYFSSIAQASRDSIAIFGEVPAYASELILWARKLTEEYGILLKKHIVSFSSGCDGLRAAADCVRISAGHCTLLENEGLSLSPLLLKLMRPCIEEAMESRLKMIDETLRVHVSLENWVLASGQNSESRTKLSTSAHRFHSSIQDLFEDAAPLANMQYGGVILDGVAHIFDNYIEMLIKSVPPPVVEGDGDIMGMKYGSNTKLVDKEAQQIVMLGSAGALADELVPRSALRFISETQSGNREEGWRRPHDKTVVSSGFPEHKKWRKRLQQGLERLRDHICRSCAYGILYGKDGELLLTAATYMDIHENGEDHFWLLEPMPSSPFQGLFLKLNRLAHVAREMVMGRERVVVLLLMQLTEEFVKWLSSDDDFWQNIENGPTLLGSMGLQQFLLDMRFVIQVASSGRYSSRRMRNLVSSLISRAMDAFSATGVDPSSVLPEDEWFEDMAQEAMRKLLAGKYNGDCLIERDPETPTSVSSSSLWAGQESP